MERGNEGRTGCTSAESYLGLFLVPLTLSLLDASGFTPSNSNQTALWIAIKLEAIDESMVLTNEAFAPTTKMTTVRILLALVASQSWPFFQMDVKNANIEISKKMSISVFL